ncbi:MAG: hypothetical protein DME98_08490 [Verrucomicrobia bacterium]|nr:MAG: hypothetical protein DME98_08490 [Verrucomicrobiota bacterium]PYJ32811.1 MAG: hypothetical protein DME88_09640 [Verrucomicrobiota bacterium]
MKPSKLEMLLSLFGSVFLMFSVFSEPLGLSEPLQWCALILAPVCFIPLIVLQRRRRNSRLAAGLPTMNRPSTKRRFWLLLSLIIAASLSGPLWLPYTGTTLPTSTLIITSIISCAFASLAFVLSWRYWNKRSNRSLQPTAGPF